MSLTIWKFPVPQAETPEPRPITMPAGAEIVAFGQQDDTPTVWAIVNPEETETEVREILVVPTGVPLNHGTGRYIGTTLLHDGDIVAHGIEVGL